MLPIIQALAPNLIGCCVVNGLVPRTLFIGLLTINFSMILSFLFYLINILF